MRDESQQLQLELITDKEHMQKNIIMIVEMTGRFAIEESLDPRFVISTTHEYDAEFLAAAQQIQQRSLVS